MGGGGGGRYNGGYNGGVLWSYNEGGTIGIIGV